LILIDRHTHLTAWMRGFDRAVALKVFVFSVEASEARSEGCAGVRT
jgi:hypothetical protein